MSDGKLRTNFPASDSMLQIGCKMFDISRVPSVVFPA